MTGRDRWRGDPWVVGWTAGAAVVAVAAGLLVTITALARRVARQAESIQTALEATRHNVEPLLDLGAVNATLAATVATVEGSETEPTAAGQRRASS